MANTLNLNLDFAKLGEIGLLGVRRASAFVALGQRAWSDETISSLALDVPFGFQLFPDPLPDNLAKEVRSNFRTWLCGAAISEMMQGLSLFADECYMIATYVTFKDGRVLQEGLDSIARCRSDTNFASKLKRLAADFGVGSELLEHADGWTRARNAYAHNRGVVRERDCTPDTNQLTVTWRQFELSANGKIIEQIIGHYVEKDTEISIRLGSGNKIFDIGNALDFSEQEILNLALTAHTHVSEITSAVENLARNLIDQNSAEKSTEG
jgi:hypothetical protein